MSYYDTCAFPKPKSKKKKLLCNGYKDKPNRVCIFCKAPYAQRHEVFSGKNRQISIREGFQIDLCPEHHREIQDNITPWAQSMNKKLRAAFQTKWENKLIKAGTNPEQAREQWLLMIGRSYL